MHGESCAVSDIADEDTPLDRFVIVGSGCSGAVPLCNHVFKGVNRAKAEAAKAHSEHLVVSGQFRREDQLSGSEGPCSVSDGRDSSDTVELQPLFAFDVVGLKCEVWESQTYLNCPQFEVFTRNLLYDFQASTRCRCKKILAGGAEMDKERRNNVSCLLQIADQEKPDEFSNILVDVGKTFRDAIMRVLVPLQVTQLDQVLITHGHSDAMGGLDDLREFQSYSVIPVNNSLRHVCHKALPITCTKDTAVELKTKFNYCFQTPENNWMVQPTGEIHMKSRWPAYEFDLIEQYLDSDNLCYSNDSENQDTSNLMKLRSGKNISTLSNGAKVETRYYPVFHGGNYICMGYGFGTVDKVLYLSDIKATSTPVLRKMIDDGPWDVLVIDCLSPIKSHYSHASLYEALNLVRAINPKIVKLVGMTCIFPPEETKELLDSWLNEIKRSEMENHTFLCGINENEVTRIQDLNLSYDGEVIPLNLRIPSTLI